MTTVTSETAELKVNLTLVAELGDLWGSEIISDDMDRILANSTFANANAGDLVGNRMFWLTDYMVCSRLMRVSKQVSHLLGSPSRFIADPTT